MRSWVCHLAVVLSCALGLSAEEKIGLPAPPRRWAVVVGVGKYQNLPASEWLPGCELDAVAVAEFLQSPRGGAVPLSQLRLLTNERAKVADIRQALADVIEQARKGDIVTVFFACHGRVKLYGAAEAGFLMGYDSQPESLNVSALPMEELRRYVDLHLRETQQVVLISDTCHAGWIQAESPLERMGERQGAVHFLASRGRELSVEDLQLGGHGIFTYCFLQALSGAGGASPEGRVRVSDVTHFLQREVPRLSEDRQHPRVVSKDSDEFVLAYLDRPGPARILQALPEGVTERWGAACLRVEHVPQGAEVYLIRGQEQRTLGRALENNRILVLEGLPVGNYRLVVHSQGSEREWPVRLGAGVQTFEIP